MKTISLLTGAHLSRNPRVVKEANALAEAGYQVSILTVWTHKEWLETDKTLIHPSIHYAGIDLTAWNSPASLFYRALRRFFQELNQRWGIESPHSLNYALLPLLRKARKTNADLYICHQETGLVLGAWLLKAGRKVAFDFEDWYSKDLLPENRASRPVKLLENMEKSGLKNGLFSLTTSHAMAAEMGQFFQTPPPEVIRNVFPVPHDLESRSHPNQPVRLAWFSQTIGPGRGLELLFQAISLLPRTPLEIHLTGDVSEAYRADLIGRLKYPGIHSLHFHRPVAPQALPAFLSRFDIGLALEQSTPESRNLTITNKIVQYLQSGLAVIATETAGQKEVAQLAPNAVFLIGHKDELAQKLAMLADDTSLLANARQAALACSREELNWEKEQERLLAVVRRVPSP
ncbi:MAG: glycosyltransferase [Saprospiraceae bacterium]